MPYKTKSGSHYHLTEGCHGATIPCSTEGLEPCSDCCMGEHGSGGIGDDASGAGSTAMGSGDGYYAQTEAKEDRGATGAIMLGHECDGSVYIEGFTEPIPLESLFASATSEHIPDGVSVIPTYVCASDGTTFLMNKGTNMTVDNASLVTINNHAGFFPGMYDYAEAIKMFDDTSIQMMAAMTKMNEAIGQNNLNNHRESFKTKTYGQKTNTVPTSATKKRPTHSQSSSNQYEQKMPEAPKDMKWVRKRLSQLFDYLDRILPPSNYEFKPPTQVMKGYQRILKPLGERSAKAIVKVWSKSEILDAFVPTSEMEDTLDLLVNIPETLVRRANGDQQAFMRTAQAVAT